MLDVRCVSQFDRALSSASCTQPLIKTSIRSKTAWSSDVIRAYMIAMVLILCRALPMTLALRSHGIVASKGDLAAMSARTMILRSLGDV